MATNTGERAAIYLQQVARLAGKDNLSVEEALEFLTDKLIELLSARLDDESLTPAERLEIFDTIAALTPSAEDLGLNEEQLLSEIDAERGEFNQRYFGIDFGRRASSNS